MNKGAWANVFAIVLGISFSGCKKQVPTDIVEKSLRSALRLHAPQTVAAMCGVNVKRMMTATISGITRKADGVTGNAHVSGVPAAFAGGPALCQGDVEFRYSYNQKTKSVAKQKSTTTTWFLEHLKLTAVQTKGVAFKPVDEDATDDDE